MKHYYAIACDLEARGDADALRSLAEEWWAQGFRYRVFGALDHAVNRFRPTRVTSPGVGS